ncbi:LON peptidase N-terminal domain and RING finger protein 3-like [Megalops cyprinoides]|uniref:LON peptidase N-terminal domain and RING finger protein 3-like n=1 Tax=Megalops cyprinoides TaxID=118141 RepID=UPI001864027C|nr:LON peptidase N-terminal domain and RING finger protein 3-like [Megalops cyprinoides]
MGTESVEGIVMLELAAEAFQAKNFQLAADIYECQLQNFADVATQQELLVKRADALAFDGRLSEAFEIYQRASKLERLRPAQLENLTECLTNSIQRKEGVVSLKNQQESGTTACGGYDAFTCRICWGYLYEPVTLPCGHCFCRKCLPRESMPVCCKECKDSSKLTDVQNYRVNVVLSNLLSKYFSSELLAVQLRQEGNRLYAEKKLEAALEKYNEAIQIAPRDHVLFSNRSQINSSLKRFEDALGDAEMACKLQPHWLKGHLRKAQALLSLRKMEEALTEYLLCIALEPESKLAKSEAQKLLSDLFAPVPDDVQEGIPDCVTLLSSRARIKGNAVTSSGSFEHTSSIRLHKDCNKSKDNTIFQEELKLPQVPSCIETVDGLDVKPACCEERSVSSVCHPTVIDRSYILKRKHSTEEEEEEDKKASGTERPCKRSKSEGMLKDGAGSRFAIASDLDAADLECSLCMRLFYEPVTTPCGHTFCLKCLERSLDHNSKCPLCKEDLSEYLAQRRYCKTFLMEDLIAIYLPDELVDRQKMNEEEIAELSNLNKNVPIFVCTMAFPTVPCPLHIFEPCYRLMIRRCMETGTKQFGMCLSNSINGFADYGCMLEIRSVEFFADGRSVVDTIGKRRFRVIQHSQRDGYNTADIEYLEDEKVEGEKEVELRTLHDAVYDQAVTWVNSLKPEQRERIEGHFGPMPEKDPEPQVSPNGPSWCWWLLAVLPLEGRAQLPFLALTSLKDRLAGIRRVLLFMSRNRSR